MTIVRKATGKVVGRNIPKVNFKLLLSCLPSGVYGIENSEGIEIALATVQNAKVRIVKLAIA